ncbi:RPA-interacting protein B [Holothuria leucospilota]|uniref:RPA-interacting protein B n=1 Tax=Holothuria leucospilota TaxID=206669 RepID=A0A9Q1HBI9_HOLLE|nr:RPA-interacting protein B [Holothuria leucospilota]
MAASITPKREVSRSKRRHEELYKSRTPPWKDVYRRRCLDRLRNSREQLLLRFRGNYQDDDKPHSPSSLVQDVLQEEWRQMQRDKDLMSFGSDDISDFEDILSLMEDMQNELMREEAALIVEAERQQQMEQEAVNISVETSSENGVICPVCKANHLMLNKGVFFCACGLRIDTKQDGFTLYNVKLMLEEGVASHSQTCRNAPNFCSIDMGNGPNLVMVCESCDVMSIII